MITDNIEVSSENILGKEKISKLFASIVLPSVISMVIIGIQTMVDGVFLGNFIEPNAMASVNIAQPYISITHSVCFGVTLGGAAYIGIMLGSNHIDRARDIYRTVMISILCSGIFFAMIGVIFSKELGMILGANEVLLPRTDEYLRTYSLFIPLIMFSIMTSFMIRVMGYAKRYLISNIAGILSNVILNTLFIIILQWGMTGAALATGLANVVALLIALPPMFDHKNSLHIFKGKFDFRMLGKVLYNGTSEAVTALSAALTAYLFNITFMKYFGEDGVTAFTTVNYISTMVTLTMFGVADGLAPIISYNYGAGMTDRVNQARKTSYGINMISGVIVYAIIWFFGEALISIYVQGDPLLVEMAYSGAKIHGIFFLICGFNIINGSFFTAIGKSKESILISGSRGVFFIVLGILILPLIFAGNGVWMVVPVADAITVIVSVYLLYRMKV